MALAPSLSSTVVTLMVLHLLASMVVAELKNLRAAVWALIIQSLTLCFVILLFWRASKENSFVCCFF